MASSIIASTACPFSGQSLPDCAVSAINGSSIPKISRYCMDNYDLCPVYKSWVVKNDSQALADKNDSLVRPADRPKRCR